MAVVDARAADDSSPPTCLVLTIEGKVELALKGQTDWQPAVTNQSVNVGDRIRTGLRSRATLRWSDQSIVRVDALTSMEIQPPQKSGGKPELDLKSGATYLFSREKPMEIQFRTPVASGAIRGTEFNLAVAENGETKLALLSGEVDLGNAQGTVTLKSGEQGNVSEGQAPTKTAVINATKIIQWALYYPAVIDPADLSFTDAETNALSASLAAYRSGDLLSALKQSPENWTPDSDAGRVYLSALLLSVGRVDEAEGALQKGDTNLPTAKALREVITVVRNEDPGPLTTPTTASESIARSYTLQSRSQLPEALAAARAATDKSPQFGAAHVRVAELEFGFGHVSAAKAALDRGLELSPRNAQGLALNGFLWIAKNKMARAADSFDQAIAADGSLGNAWLGRGLLKIRRGETRDGLKDLEVAAAVEPQRAVLRSYLGKAFAQTWDAKRARKELALARELDPNDPTPWLYSALLNEQENQPNEAITDLEKSKELNDNRSVFRSRLLLDQDQAVRGANLAAIYRDAGLVDVSVQEAARAVNYDYANFSAHQFLANSFDALRDPKLVNVRYETAWYSELLLANLLSPVNGANLSQSVSQQEYSRLFAGNHIGVFSATEYSSHGDWAQSGSQYGVIGSSAYSVDAFYQSQRGYRPNNDLEQLSLAARFKQEITPHDSLFVQVSYFDTESGDVAQYYNQSSASQTLRVTETQEPNVLVGYHHEWSPGSHTLVMVSRFDDQLDLDDSAPSLLWLRTAISPFTGATNVSVVNPTFVSLNYESELVAYSAEVQHIWQTPRQTLIIGAREQVGWPDTHSQINRQPPLSAVTTIDQTFEPELSRESVYAYEHFKPLDSLLLVGGVTYDHLRYPANVDTAPISPEEKSREQISPKAGILWSPLDNTHLRGDYTRSLGGVFFDNSIRLEPAQIVGFNQAFRSLIPESVSGLVPGTRFETFGLGLDQSFKTRTYLTIQAELLKSRGNRTVGILTNSDQFVPTPDMPSSTGQSLEYEEKSLLVGLNQLVGRNVAVGIRYKLTEADLDQQFNDIPPNINGASALNRDVSATLHQVMLYAGFQHRCGFFGEFNAIWSQQSNRDYTPDIPGDDFWQFNVYLGYRFWLRHGEARLGLINLTDQDYRLNPLTLHNELPRERALTFSLKFYY